MKKFIILFMLFCSVLSLSTTHELVTSGEHKDWYKLKDFNGENKFDVYFQISKNGSIVSQNYEIIPNYKSVNLKEKVTVTHNGKKVTRTKKEWYDLIWEYAAGNKKAMDAVEKVFPEIYEDFMINNMDFDDGIVEKYIFENFKDDNTPITPKQSNDYCKQDNLSKKDMKRCAELAEQEYLENFGDTVENKSKPKKKKSWLDSIGNAVGSFLDEAANSTF